MSDAIDYLLQARPKAMQSYFAFLRQSGGALDPKTRALISVITKVAARTDRGFRQYLVRAMRVGCSAEEILDALLAAFPVIGLTGLTWAVDIILEMDIPEFRPELLGQQPTWHDVMALDELSQGITRMACDDRELFIRRDGDEVAVYDSRCPHQVTNIPQLALEGDTLTCPRHGWQFDVRDGSCIAKGNRPLTRFDHRIEQGRLQAYW